MFMTYQTIPILVRSPRDLAINTRMYHSIASNLFLFIMRLLLVIIPFHFSSSCEMMIPLVSVRRLIGSHN